MYLIVYVMRQYAQEKRPRLRRGHFISLSYKPNSVCPEGHDSHLSGTFVAKSLKRHFPRFLSGHGLAHG